MSNMVGASGGPEACTARLLLEAEPPREVKDPPPCPWPWPWRRAMDVVPREPKSFARDSDPPDREDPPRKKGAGAGPLAEGSLARAGVDFWLKKEPCRGGSARGAGWISSCGPSVSASAASSATTTDGGGFNSRPSCPCPPPPSITAVGGGGVACCSVA